MDWKILTTTFGLIFLAELGDKTQLAAMALSSSSSRPWSVFLGAWLALGVTTALGVIVGRGLEKVVSPKVISGVSAVLFIGVGIWMLYSIFRNPGTGTNP